MQPLSYRQWLQLKANDTSGQVPTDVTYSKMLLDIVGRDGNLDANAVGENRQLTGDDGQVYYTAGPEGDFAEPGKGLMDVNDSMIQRYNAYTSNPDLVAEYNNGPVGGGGTGGTGGGGQQFQDTSGARNATQSALDQLDTILGNKNEEAKGGYDNILEQYLGEETENEAKFVKNREGNESTRGAQNQAALLAAANGGRGLFSTLASIGALGGTGKTLANRAVSNEANIDIGNANKTFDTNATALNDSYGELEKEQDQRRLDAKNTYDKTVKANEYDILDTRQGLYKDMADLWTKAGNNDQANKYLGNVAKLQPKLAETSRPTVPEYAKKQMRFKAPALKNYLAGANDMTVKAAPAQAGGGGPINGAVYTSTKRRDEL